MPASSRTRHGRPPHAHGGPARAAEERISHRLAEHIGSHRYDMWFGHTRLKVEGDALEVATDSPFVARWIDTHFASELRSAATDTLGASATIQVSVRPELFPQEEDGEGLEGCAAEVHVQGSEALHGRAAVNGEATVERSAAPPRLRPGRGPLHELGEYVVGTSNRLAWSAACRLLEDGGPAISPLFVHGECGVGKTHLLQGICRRFAELGGAPQGVRYVTGEQFTNEYIAAIRANNGLDAFRRRMRKLDLLAVDDVHFLSNKVRTQSEFLHTLDAIDVTGARIVLASDEHPRHIGRFSQALVSRFLSGMVVQVERPDRTTRLELIRRLAHARGLRLNQAATEALAARCTGSVRELEGAITKLAALRQLAGGPEDGDEVGAVLVDRLFAERTWHPAAPVRLGAVIDCVCARLAIARSDLLGAGRHRKVVLARGLVAHLARELTTHSYPEIAQAMGRTYHSTVHTAAARLRRQMDANEALRLHGGELPIVLRDLVDHLRHEIVNASRPS